MEAYRELSCIGRGTQAAVYTVRHLEEGTVYVLKRMHVGEAEARRTALLEAETLQRLQHPAVVGYRDTFVDGEFLCIVMEYCEGGDLASRIASCGGRCLPEEQILQWTAELVLALHHVHERGVLHRDLKTHNVFVAASGRVRLGDFGIAKLLGTQEVQAATCVGTPYYMPPELFRNERYDAKADVWALGCVLFELAARRRAFQAPNLNSLAMKVARGKYGQLPPSYSSGLHELVRSLLAVQPSARPSLASLLTHPLLRRHVVAYGERLLGSASDAQIASNPALASLRIQLATAGLAHSSSLSARAPLPDDSSSPLPSARAPGAAPDARDERRDEKRDERREHALRKLDEERRWRARERRACRALAAASSHTQHAGLPDPADAAAPSAPPVLCPLAGPGGGLQVSDEGPQTSRAAAAPDWVGGDVSFREQFSMSRSALHGRRAAGDTLSDDRHSLEVEIGADREMYTSPLSAAFRPPPMAYVPEYSLPAAVWEGARERWPSGEGHDAFDSEGDADIDSARPTAYAVVPPGSGEVGGEPPSEYGEYHSEHGLSAKERVLARRELRKRAEEAAREDQLMHARQRYFQERVLADHAKRSQYLGSFVPLSSPLMRA